MRLSNKYGGIQFFASALGDLTVNFDSHITKAHIDCQAGGFDFTTSGQTISLGAINDETVYFTVTLDTGYIIDTVSFGSPSEVSNVVIEGDGTGFTFTNDGSGIFGTPITITSKRGGTTMSKSYDLSTSANWANLAAGSHTVKLKAKGSGYADSPFSNEVSVTKAASTKTLEAGTYKWVDSPAANFISYFNLAGQGDIDIAFDSAGVAFGSISIEYASSYSVYVPPARFTVYSSISGWVLGDDYQTITLVTPQTVSADFYNWAITGGNLVKQEGETWVLNEIPVVPSDKMEIDVGFNSNGNDFNQFYAFSRDGIIYIMDGAQTQAWNANWIDESYRTITFTQPVTDTTLLTWLQANGTKQGGVTEHTLTFNDLDSLTVNGLAVTSPYTLQNGDVIVATKKAVWGDTPNDSYEATVGASYDGNDITVHSGSDTISVSNANIAITAWTTLHPGSGEMDNAVLTINYTA